MNDSPPEYRKIFRQLAASTDDQDLRNSFLSIAEGRDRPATLMGNKAFENLANQGTKQYQQNLDNLTEAEREEIKRQVDIKSHEQQ